MRKLYSIKLKERENEVKHITKILETIDKLNDIGESINDCHTSAIFLCSLTPHLWHCHRTALEYRPKNKLIYQSFIHNKLVDEFNRHIE